MNKRSFATLFFVSGVFLALHVPVTHAGVPLGGSCNVNSATATCAAGLECSNGRCQQSSDKIGGSLQLCKDKLRENGMGSGGRTSMYKNFCYDSVSCPDIYDQVQLLGRSMNVVELLAFNEEWLELDLEAQLAVRKEAESQREATIIKAASQACSQCKSGGKPRCFYPAMDILY